MGEKKDNAMAFFEGFHHRLFTVKLDGSGQGIAPDFGDPAKDHEIRGKVDEISSRYPPALRFGIGISKREGEVVQGDPSVFEIEEIGESPKSPTDCSCDVFR
jgi:hypothetical protein